jgi:hypothetical protein
MDSCSEALIHVQVERQVSQAEGAGHREMDRLSAEIRSLQLSATKDKEANEATAALVRQVGSGDEIIVTYLQFPS